MRKGCALFLVVLTVGMTGAAQAQMTPARVAESFSEGVSEVCVPAVAVAGGISTLPESIRALVSPAPEAARFLAAARNPEGPIWNLESANGVIIVSEPGPGQCEVIAYGAPVASTFASVTGVLTAADFDEDLAGRQGPPFFRQEFVGVGAKTGIQIVLDGTEPGAPGRAFRFSLLSGYVTFAQPSEQ